MHDHNTTDKSIQSMRPGFTMIELIFVIVIIVILAAIALPKLAAVRDDAELSSDVSNMNICIRDMGAIYASSRADLNDTYSNSYPCNKVLCYTTEINKTIMKVNLNSAGANYCANIEEVGGYLARTYQFLGASITR